jgi:hypothetical protein
MSLFAELNSFIDSWLFCVELGLNLSVKFASIAGIIGLDSKNKLKEDDSNRPYISLHRLKDTLSPYFFLV